MWLFPSASHGETIGSHAVRAGDDHTLRSRDAASLGVDIGIQYVKHNGQSGAKPMTEARIVRSAEGEIYEPTWVFKHGVRTGGPFDFAIGAVTYLGGPPLHVHREQHDTFYVLDGVLAVQVGDEVFDLLAGDFATVPPGISHTFDNVRKDQPPVRVCNLMVPGGLDDFFVSLNALGPQPHDPAQLAAAGETAGVTFVGPTIGQKLGLA